MKKLYDEDEIKKIHSSLNESSAKIIGEFHLFLTYAEKMVYDENSKADKNDFSKGQEIGNSRSSDVIELWISSNEKNLYELETKVKNTLDVAESVKTSAVHLYSKGIVKYKQLVEEFVKFAEENKSNFEKLLKFVKWLSETDLNRASILFAHISWGSTRIGERTIHFKNPYPFVKETINISTEIVFGLRKSTDGMQYFSSISEFCSSWADSHDPEEYQNYKGPDPSRVEDETCRLVLGQFLEYFKFVRDDLRLVLNEIRKEIRKGHQRADQNFWVKFVNHIIEKNPPEDRLWDLKGNLPIWTNNRESGKKGQYSLAKDIAAFANSSGGVIIVGISDNPREIKGVNPDENQLNNITNVVSRLTNLSPDLVEVYSVHITEERYKNKIIIVICIPQSRTTIYVKDSDEKFTYMVRGTAGNLPVKKEIIDSKRNGYIVNDNFDFFNELKSYIR